MTTNTHKPCIYCGSREHSNADCRHPSKAETMTALYGSGSASEVAVGLPANVVHSMDAAIHNAMLYGTGATLDGVSIEPYKLYVMPVDNTALVEVLQRAVYVADNEGTLSVAEYQLCIDHIESLK